LATHATACQVQNGMSGSPVAIRAGASLLVRRLLPRVRQHSALSAVSWHSDLRGAANTQQLQRQNFCSRWTSLVELSSGPAAQSRHHLKYGLFTFSANHEFGALWLLICGALEKQLLTYLLLTLWLFLIQYSMFKFSKVRCWITPPASLSTLIGLLSWVIEGSDNLHSFPLKVFYYVVKMHSW